MKYSGARIFNYFAPEYFIIFNFTFELSDNSCFKENLKHKF